MFYLNPIESADAFLGVTYQTMRDAELGLILTLIKKFLFAKMEENFVN